MLEWTAETMMNFLQRLQNGWDSTSAWWARQTSGKRRTLIYAALFVGGVAVGRWVGFPLPGGL